jgi:glycerol kinase
MESRVIVIDQSTSATKAMLFTEEGELIQRINISHHQYYPKAGWVEHDAKEIINNVVKSIADLVADDSAKTAFSYSLALTNQRETVVVWDKKSGDPVYHAIVWQCLRGSDICRELIEKGYSDTVRKKSGLMIDPYFSASGVKWILDNVEGARKSAEKGELLMGTIDSWIIWNLTNGEMHATDYTNASRTLLFNIDTLNWDDELLEMFTIPKKMMPEVLPSDAVFGETTVKGLFNKPILITGVLGDSHAALAGQMCFRKGTGKATYGTGSSVMVNIGEERQPAPRNITTTIGYSALGKVYYAFEGNIHCTGATISWLQNQLGIISSPKEIETLLNSVDDNNGVYFIPAFAGLSAPWWEPNVKGAILGLTLGANKGHILRAAVESIAYQIRDLIDAMNVQNSIPLKELCVDGGATGNQFLMQFQADILQTTIHRLQMEEASALGAVIMNGFGRNKWNSFEEVTAIGKKSDEIRPKMIKEKSDLLYHGWLNAIRQLMK